MSRHKSKEELEAHKASALSAVDSLLTQYIQSNNPAINGKADKLCYWLEDYMKFLEYEPQFSPTSLRRYKRGEIITVHLGYNIGSEEGGLHYAVVLDNANSIYSPVITILPLTSVKPNVDTSNLRPGCIYLGNELFTSLSAKVSSHYKYANTELDKIRQSISLLDTSSPLYTDLLDNLQKRLNDMKEEAELISKMKTEIQKMKVGSIGLLNQITTISKIRIYDPKTNQNILSGIKLSNEKLDLIDDKIKLLYTKVTKSE